MPDSRNGLLDLGAPLPGVDERDIMFSRALLVPGTERYEEYYGRRPEHREKDDLFRKEAGLLQAGSTHHHPLGFPAADAAFWTVERLRPFVESSGEPTANPVRREGEILDPGEVTLFLKAWALKLGAHSVGIATLRDYHLYTHVGRGEEYGRPVELDHSHALALTVEMDREMVDSAPRSPTVMESARQYLSSGVMAVQLADTIRRLGYRARAHIDGNYRVICPLVAKDAGLGEIGRMGLLMTPRLGPRVRIAVVTTDLPLVPDSSERDLTVIDICRRCLKCADACPSRALSFGSPESDEKGVVRWRVDAEACFTLWAKLGTDCARCMSVCPYSHPDNVLHNLVRWGIRRSTLFRRAAVWMDDLVYGRRPAPKPPPNWMKGLGGSG
jgi:reductive dehalogenase